MKILFCGDIVGRSGRDAFAKYTKPLREALGIDCVIVNGENAAHGFGINPNICRDLYSAGADVITTGNHIWDQKEIMSYMDMDKKVLRPVNYPAGTPGAGSCVFETQKGQKVLVVNVMGRLFMDTLDDPFPAIDAILKKHPLGHVVHAVVVDMHAEATSEKMAMGHFCDGRASLVVGTHTHIPTADGQILEKGTAYQSDAGMCGDYNSVVGMDKEVPLFKFLRKMPAPERMKPATGEGTLCGVLVETDPTTGLALSVEPIQVGGRLRTLLPHGVSL
jgi:metallophosphoesterase (TIGR00282 family)